MTDFVSRAAIVGYGATDFSKNSGRSELQLALEATLAALRRAPDDELQASIRHSPMYRTKVWRLRRNLALAIAASSDPDAHAALRAPRSADVDPSFGHPIVVEHITWALARLEARRVR